jgi:transcriptional repressor NrdR
MNCPSCDSQTRVVETREASGGSAVRRRRECLGCGRRFTTKESPVLPRTVVLKRDGGSEPFDRDKLRRALVAAAHKRPVSRSQIERVVDRVESRASAAEGALPATRIGELVLAELRDLDYGAYLQFAGTMPDPKPEFAASRTASSVRGDRLS